MVSADILLNKLLGTKLGQALQAEVTAGETTEAGRDATRAELQKLETARRAEHEAYAASLPQLRAAIEAARRAYDAALARADDRENQHTARLYDLIEREQALRKRLWARE